MLDNGLLAVLLLLGIIVSVKTFPWGRSKLAGIQTRPGGKTRDE